MLVDFDIRDCATTHSALLSALHGAIFDVGWDGDNFVELLKLPMTIGFLAIDNSRFETLPAGFILISQTKLEAEVLTLGVVSAYRRCRAGTALVDHAVSVCRKAGVEDMFLEVDAGDAHTVAFYRTLGFLKAGLRPCYYKRTQGPRADALIMHKQIG